MAVDYDPQKAHEYYERHKKLKGRGKRSTKGFSKTQKAQWAYAKEQLKEEHREIGHNITEESKATRQELSDTAKSRIKALRESLKGMSKEERAEAKERITGLIDSIKERLRGDKADLTETTKGKREQESEDYEQRKDTAYKTIKAMGKK